MVFEMMFVVGRLKEVRFSFFNLFMGYSFNRTSFDFKFNSALHFWRLTFWRTSEQCEKYNKFFIYLSFTVNFPGNCCKRWNLCHFRHKSSAPISCYMFEPTFLLLLSYLNLDFESDNISIGIKSFYLLKQISNFEN